MSIQKKSAYLFVGVFIFFSLATKVQAVCNQTLSPGANITSAVSSAASGSTICLNSGNYGSVNLTNIARTGYVTLQSTTGTGAKMSPQVNNTDYVKFQSITLSDMQILNCSTNIQVIGNTWAPNTGGAVVYDYGYGCAATNKQILIDGNTFVNTKPSWGEGKIGLVSANGVTITNNLIQGQSASNGGDGIQTGGSLANITIGPGNIFRDIRQAPCDSTSGVPHCDSIQFVGDCPTCTITSNWFDNVEVVLQHHDAIVPVVFTNNLITNAQQMWAYSTPGSASNSRIEHNTFYNLGLAMWGTSGSGVSDTTGLIGRNNIFIGTSNAPSTCNTPSCTFSYNLGGTSAQTFGTNAITGQPTFVGGSNPSAWAGWQLTSGSLGKSAGSDGSDVGTTYYGSSAPSDDTTAPALTQVAVIPILTRDNTPNYVFSSNEAGAMTYAGDCTSGITSATASNNTITLNTIARGTHSNCSLKVTDAAGNQSSTLAIPSFTVTYWSDLNLDRSVNVSDFELLNTHYGTANSAGDANFDGAVNMLDFGVMRTEYGESI